MARIGHRMLCWQPLLARGYTGIPHCLDFDSIDVSHELCAVFPRTAVAVPAGLFLPHVARRVDHGTWDIKIQVYCTVHLNLDIPCAMISLIE